MIRNKWAKIISLLSLTLLSSTLLGQSLPSPLKTYFALHFPDHWVDSTQTFVGLSSAQADSLLDLTTNYLQGQGYLEASITPQPRKAGFGVTAFMGPQYAWKSLKYGDLADSVIVAIRYHVPDGGSLSYPDFQKWLIAIARFYADRGYPFAKVSAGIPTLHPEHQLVGEWAIEPGVYIAFAEPVFPPGIKLKPYKLARLAHIPVGTPYSESAIQQLPKALARLPYIRLTSDAQVSFANHTAKVAIPLVGAKANNINVLVGLFPGAEGAPPTLAGEAKIDLWNPLGFGNRYQIIWERLQPQTQQLYLLWDLWYPLGQPIIVKPNFALWRQDSAFLRQEFAIDVLSGGQEGWQWGGYFQRRSFRRLQDSTEWIPGGAQNANHTLGGVKLIRDSKAYFKDWDRLSNAELRFGAGSRTSESVPKLFFEIKGSGSYFHPLSDLFGIYTSINAAYQPSNVSGSEAFRLGGFQLLRGFNEQAIYASAYGIGTAEVRLKTAFQSYLVAFLDQGWVNLTSTFESTMWPTGVGLGMQWQLPAGLLQVYWATGRGGAGAPFSLETSKIHFGFGGRF